MKCHHLFLLHFSIFRLVDVTVIAQLLLESPAISSVESKSCNSIGSSIKDAKSGHLSTKFVKNLSFSA